MFFVYDRRCGGSSKLGSKESNTAAAAALGDEIDGGVAVLGEGIRALANEADCCSEVGDEGVGRNFSS